MPLANNILLQTAAAAKSQAAISSNVAKPADISKDSASSFADVYAKQAQNKPAASISNPTKTKATTDNSPPAKSSNAAASDKSVAGSGKSLPAKSASDSTDTSKATASSNSSTTTNTNTSTTNTNTTNTNTNTTSNANGDSTTASTVDSTTTTVASDDSTDSNPVDPSLIAATADQTPVVDPTANPTPDPALDPTLQAMVAQPVVTPPLAVQPSPEKTVTPSAEPVVASTPSTTPAPAPQPAVATDPQFDPAADPLEGMPALQLALENNAKAQQAAQSAANTGAATTTDKTGKGQDDSDPTQALANNLSMIVDQKPVDKTSTESGGDKAFSSLIDDGLKDVKTAGSDTRVDNFAERLAAMSQAAVQPKAAAAVPLLNQPLAMHQSGWSESVVDRVMYMSSQNLKSADIQLEPAELGRLDIRVNMAADQQTQVTFMSAHVGVREALENQMSRLRDSFSQQGMGQVDVNVSDQSRGWQQPGQEQAANGQSRGNGGPGGTSGADRLDGSGDDVALDGVQSSQPATVIGSSAVDYYA